ncbi:MAG TPA: methyltransferase domain-containing protein [Stellaceae bacterium]|jgi:SAM-dependent methyltransferase|nr:methyltransferase domain-containing protein [Stellaceae bacterium]
MKSPEEQHREQLVYWRGDGGDRWIGESERTEMMLAPVAARLMAVALPRPGEAVLDVGCGLGPTTIELARQVGPSGRAVGLDLSAAMIAKARQHGAGAGNLEFIADDAAIHEFPAPFADLLFSRFGVMFFGDPTAAFTNLRKAMRPKGRIVFACWRRLSENPWMLNPLLAAYRHVPRLPPASPDDPGPFSLADADRVTRILTAAGFSPPRFTPFDLAVDIAGGGGLEAAVHQSMTIGATSRALQDQSDAVRAAAAQSIRDALAPYLKDDAKVEMPAAVWIVESVT